MAARHALPLARLQRWFGLSHAPRDCGELERPRIRHRLTAWATPRAFAWSWIARGMIAQRERAAQRPTHARPVGHAVKRSLYSPRRTVTMAACSPTLFPCAPSR